MVAFDFDQSLTLVCVFVFYR